MSQRSEIVYHCHTEGWLIFGICADDEEGVSLGRVMRVEEGDTVKVIIDGLAG